MIKDADISPGLRLEILKRDKFTCRCCGQQVPKVVLCVDYVQDPSNLKGVHKEDPEGNLVTLCTTCHNNYHHAMQPTALEMMETRKHQLKQLIEWKQNWADFDSYAVQLVVDYVNSKLEIFTLDRNTVTQIANAFKSHHILTIIDIIDEAYRKSVQFTSSGKIIKKTAEEFVRKIPIFICHAAKTPLNQKIGYVRGACCNEYGQGVRSEATSLLTSYSDALLANGYANDMVMKSFDESIIPAVNYYPTWSEFSKVVREWINEIDAWKVSL